MTGWRIVTRRIIARVTRIERLVPRFSAQFRMRRIGGHVIASYFCTFALRDESPLALVVSVTLIVAYYRYTNLRTLNKQMQPPKPQIILEFDRVLFDTDGYLAGLAEAVRALGAEKSFWNAALAQATSSQPLNLGSLASHLADATGLDRGELLKALQTETDDGVWYLYPDARPFFDHFRERADLYLLTSGDPELQTAKIEATGIHHYFQDIVITNTPKSQDKKLPLSSVSRALFLSDSVAEMMDLGGRFRWSYLLHVNRAQETLPPNFSLRSFATLREAAPTVAEIVQAETIPEPADAHIQG